MLTDSIIAQYDLDRTPCGPRALLTRSNPKTAKGEKHGYLTAIMHFAPADLSGHEVCPHRSAGCTRACLNTAGRGGVALDTNAMNAIQVARIRRTRWFHRDRKAFLLQLAVEIAAHEERAIRHGLKPAVRLNGTSDILWERVRVGKHRNIMAMFPGVVFYDYTKIPMKFRADRVAAIPNYSLTYSLSEDNDAYAEQALIAGVNVATALNVRKGQPLPERFKIGRITAKVIDGDATDLRFLDGSGLVLGYIVGLRAKGRGKADESGFVRNVTI